MMHMEKTTIKMKKGAKVKDPILIVGLPGIGSVGKIVAEHLKREFKAKRIATLYSPHFPNQVIMTKSGGVRLVSNKFYLIKAKNGQKSDIVLLTGDFQALSPEGQYEVNAKIVRYFKEKLNGKFIYTVGGYVSGEEKPAAKPRVFGNATDKATIDELKKSKVVFGQSRGAIWGSAGMIIAFAKFSKLHGICLMGETSYMDFDAAAAKAVIEVLADRLHLKIKTDDVDKVIKETAKVINELERQLKQPSSGSEGGEDTTHKLSYIR